MHPTATWLEEVSFPSFFLLCLIFFSVEIVFEKTTWLMSLYCSHKYLTIICMNPISNAKLLNCQIVNVNADAHHHHRYLIGILCTGQRRSERYANEKCRSIVLKGFACIDCKSYINDMLRAGNKRLAEVVNVQQWQNDLPVRRFARSFFADVIELWWYTNLGLSLSSCGRYVYRWIAYAKKKKTIKEVWACSIFIRKIYRFFTCCIFP